jgi:hypothetical protein
VNLCRYKRVTPEITPELLDVVCETYFIDNSQPGTTQAS